MAVSAQDSGKGSVFKTVMSSSRLCLVLCLDTALNTALKSLQDCDVVFKTLLKAQGVSLSRVLRMDVINEDCLEHAMCYSTTREKRNTARTSEWILCPHRIVCTHRIVKQMCDTSDSVMTHRILFTRLCPYTYVSLIGLFSRKICLIHMSLPV